MEIKFVSTDDGTPIEQLPAGTTFVTTRDRGRPTKRAIMLVLRGAVAEPSTACARLHDGEVVQIQAGTRVVPVPSHVVVECREATDEPPREPAG